MSFGAELLIWYKKNKRELPWRETRNPYLIWLSEIILQQTRVEQGLSYYDRFAEKYPDIFKLAKAKQDDILKLWQGLGYYSRARNLHTTARDVVQKYNGRFPDQMEDLLSLKGIGDYTASAIASFAFDRKEPVVDGNVFRLLSRYIGIKTPIDSSGARKEFRAIASELMGDFPPHIFNQAIMEFGSKQCRPSKPDCENCPLHNSCFAFGNKKVAQFPVKSQKQIIRERHLHYLFIQHGNSFYLRKRSGNDIWKNLYEFPMIETLKKTSEEKIISSSEWKTIFGKSKIHVKNVSPAVRHLLSHQTLLAKFYIVNTSGGKFKPGDDWKAVTNKTVHKFAVPKLIENFLKTVAE